MHNIKISNIIVSKKILYLSIHLKYRNAFLENVCTPDVQPPFQYFLHQPAINGVRVKIPQNLMVSASVETSTITQFQKIYQRTYPSRTEHRIRTVKQTLQHVTNCKFRSLLPHSRAHIIVFSIWRYSK
jgi:GR25 family glycosyltransferase involved in LPS biosynthesis